MSFVMLTQVGLRNHVLSGERVQIPEGKGTWVAPTCVAAMRLSSKFFDHLLFITPPPIGQRSIVMMFVCLSVCVRVCVFVCRRSYPQNYTSNLQHTFCCMLPMAVVRSSSCGVLIRYVLPVLWMTSYLLKSQGCSTSPPSGSAVHTQCAVIWVAGQRTHGTTFRALKVTSRVAKPGAESAVYDCLVCYLSTSRCLCTMRRRWSNCCGLPAAQWRWIIGVWRHTAVVKQ